MNNGPSHFLRERIPRNILMRLVPPALRGRGHRSAVSLPLVAALVLAAVSAMHAAGLRAGAALVEITPTNLPIRTAGNLTLTVVKEINDPLHARAFVLDDGATRL